MLEFPKLTKVEAAIAVEQEEHCPLVVVACLVPPLTCFLLEPALMLHLLRFAHFSHLDFKRSSGTIQSTLYFRQSDPFAITQSLFVIIQILNFRPSQLSTRDRHHLPSCRLQGFMLMHLEGLHPSVKGSQATRNLHQTCQLKMRLHQRKN